MITIYGHQRCGYCKKAKALAEQYNLKYEWLDTDTPEIMTTLKEAVPTARSVPQIFWGTRYVGGYDSFAAEVENTLGNYGQGTL